MGGFQFLWMRLEDLFLKIKFPRINLKTGYLFFYVIVTSVLGKTVALHQMVTEKHDTNQCRLFLQNGKKAGLPVPNEIITDISLPLLGGASLSYNGCDYVTYLNHCFHYLQGLEKELMPCFIRLDKAHVIKAVSRWKCFRGLDSRVKDYYLRVIAYAMDIESLSLLRSLYLLKFS